MPKLGGRPWFAGLWTPWRSPTASRTPGPGQLAIEAGPVASAPAAGAPAAEPAGAPPAPVAVATARTAAQGPDSVQLTLPVQSGPPGEPLAGSVVPPRQARSAKVPRGGRAAVPAGPPVVAPPSVGRPSVGRPAAGPADGGGGARNVARLRGDEALALIDASPDAIIGLDAYARVVFANAVAERTFGEQRHALVGAGADDLIPHLARAVTSLRMRIEAGDVVPGPAGVGTELAAVRADGSRFPATVWLTPVRAGRRMIIAATVRDLTPQRTADAHARRQAAELSRVRQQAEHNVEQVSAILRAVSERVIILADASGTITAFNRAAERLLGYSAAEMIGQPTTRLSDPDELAAVAQELGIDPAIDPLLELTRSGLPNTQDWSYVTDRGERRPVSLRITAIGNRTDPSGFVCVAEDRSFSWSPVGAAASTTDRLLLDLDDAETRSLRWQVGGSRYARRS